MNSWIINAAPAAETAKRMVSPANAHSGQAAPSIRPRQLRTPLVVHALLFASIVLAFSTSLASAQELFRHTVPREENLESAEIQTENLPYTIKKGEFRLLATPSLELDWVDNVNLSHHNAISDVILRPLLQLDGSYPLTHRNLLRFSVGVGYDIYLDHSEFDALRLLSGSEVSFDTYIKDFVINVHDRFRYIQDPAEQAAVASTARFGGLYNTAGVSATWDRRDLLLGLGYDHDNFLATSGEFDYLNRASEILTSEAGFRVNPAIITGPEAGGSFTRYDKPFLNDNTGYNVGAFAEWRPGRYFRVRAHAGYAAYLFDQTSTQIRAEDRDSWYARLTITHELGEAFSYSLDLGHEIRLGTDADSIEAWYARPGIDWRLIKNLRFRAYLGYEHGDQGRAGQGGGVVETYDWLGLGFNLSHPITKNLAASLRYRLTLRSSDIADREYTQNLVGLILAYECK